MQNLVTKGVGKAVAEQLIEEALKPERYLRETAGEGGDPPRLVTPESAKLVKEIEVRYQQFKNTHNPAGKKQRTVREYWWSIPRSVVPSPLALHHVCPPSEL